MIKSVTANAESFKPARFEEAFNVVLAERTEEGSDRDSTNGSGKTLLLEIVHFVFGADASRSPACDPHLEGWSFTVEAVLGGRLYRAMREVDSPARVHVEGDFEGWPILPREDEENGQLSFSVDDWTEALGVFVYGLPLGSDAAKFRPTFRSVFSYAVRRGLRSFGDPFNFFPMQPAWQQHVANGYLLGLDWKIYQRAKLFDEREQSLGKATKAIASALRSGALGDFEGIGDLEARRINLDREVRDGEEELRTFQVDPQYHRHERRATSLTEQIHDVVAETVQDRETLAFYERSLTEEQSAQPRDVAEMYAEMGVQFPEHVTRQFSDALAFHDRLIANRREYLSAEMQRLGQRVADREARVERLTGERARELSFLRDHGALEDLAQLQILHTRRVEELGRIGAQIDQLRGFEESLAEVRIQREELKLEARRDFDERRAAWGRVIELFGIFTAELYAQPGQLVVDINRDGGLKLGVEIERGASQGVQEMTVFCYDLAVACALSEREVGPQLVFHDSSIFDGVDPRQKAAAIRLAARQAVEHSFQYTLCLNTGDVPWDDLGDFDLRQYERLALSDVGDGGLLGIRY